MPRQKHPTVGHPAKTVSRVDVISFLKRCETQRGFLSVGEFCDLFCGLFFLKSHNCTSHFRVIPVGNLPNPSETRRNRLARAAAKALTPSLRGGTTVSSVGL